MGFPTGYSENSYKKLKKFPQATTLWRCCSLTPVLSSYASSDCGLRLPNDLIAQMLQTLDQLALHLVTIPLMEELLSFLLIFLPSFHHLIVDDEYVVSNSQCR